MAFGALSVKNHLNNYMKTFLLKDLYKEYLQKVGLDESKMPETQKRETQRAFYGGCGHMLILLLNKIGDLEEAEGAAAMDDLLNQVCNFWIAETNAQN